MTQPQHKWAGHNENMWTLVDANTTGKLKPGIYGLDVKNDMFGGYKLCLCRLEPKHDTTVSVGVADYIANEVKKFRASRAKYHRHGLLHKRGFLLHGEPGTGKTMAAMLAIERCIAAGDVAIIASPAQFVREAVGSIRKVEPDLPLICLWEDIDNWAKKGARSDRRRAMTSFLDGDGQADNIVHIATTNFFSALDPAFANRPGRFDDVLEIKAPDAETRFKYLKTLVPDPALEPIVRELADKSDGFLLAHLKDSLVSVFALEHSVDSTIARLKTMIATAPEAATVKADDDDDD